MIVCNVELNESTNKYADYIRWFASLGIDRQRDILNDLSRKSCHDFSAYAMGNTKRIKYGDAVEKFSILRQYIENNNLVNKY